MSSKKADSPALPLTDEAVADYRHPDKTRKNIPPAGLAAQGKIKETPKVRYEYNPHLPPVLRFDQKARADVLLEKAGRQPLAPQEVQELAALLEHNQPWLEWSGKREQQACEVDPVALHIHERVSAQAILRVAARQDIPRNLFADPEQEYRDAVQFYQHNVTWANRLILGDSLQVMASLAKREDLAGKIQMIYMDPPYGIKFASNFQSEVGKRQVGDKAVDLTREPETVKAYRDTWTLGVHSYLSYLRDRFAASRELLTDSGSIFVQIGDENVHQVRYLMEEIFGRDNFVVTIIVKKKSVTTMTEPINDYLLWFAKDRAMMFSRRLSQDKGLDDSDSRFTKIELPNGERRDTGICTEDELARPDVRFLTDDYPMVSQDPSSTRSGRYVLQDQELIPGPSRHWTFDPVVDMKRLERADRLRAATQTLRGITYFDDNKREPIPNIWNFHGERDPVYVVQTNRGIVERCILMTTNTGDLVLDPTCGSGTTAVVAEQWGRRWITIDSSRVPLAIARQRLLTAQFDYYRLKNQEGCVSGGFVCKSVPHITLKSIAQNNALDPVFGKWEPILADKLEYLNLALAEVAPSLRQQLKLKLAQKEKLKGKKLITDADRRRWNLPDSEWKEWEVPFDTDPDWPETLREALTEYRKAWRAKRDEVNAVIAVSAAQEELVDKPEVVKNVLRVSGPFTVEGVMPAEETLDLDSPIGGEPAEDLETFADEAPDSTMQEPTSAVNADAYLSRMIQLIRADGVRFMDNKVRKFARLDAISNGDILHAEGEWGEPGQERRVAVVFGPQVGSLSAKMVDAALFAAFNRRAYDDLLFAAYSFDAAAQAVIQTDPNPRLRCHLAHISPDTQMGDLLKTTNNSQLFTVFGLPRVAKKRLPNDEWQIEMEGVDIYDPVENTLRSTTAEKVAAWFLDSDFDPNGCFCITQAFFPDPKAWEKLSKALTGVVDAERFAAFSGTKSLPFPAGKRNCAAVKVIDPRGNEVLRVISLTEEERYV